MMRRTETCEDLRNCILAERTAGAKSLKWEHVCFVSFLFLMNCRKVSSIGEWWALIESKVERYPGARSRGAWESWHGVDILKFHSRKV